MDTTTRMPIEQIARLGYRAALARDHVEAANDESSERFIVRGGDWDSMVEELAGMVGVEAEAAAAEVLSSSGFRDGFPGRSPRALSRSFRGSGSLRTPPECETMGRPERGHPLAVLESLTCVRTRASTGRYGLFLP